MGAMGAYVTWTSPDLTDAITNPTEATSVGSYSRVNKFVHLQRYFQSITAAGSGAHRMNLPTNAATTSVASVLVPVGFGIYQGFGGYIPLVAYRFENNANRVEFRRQSDGIVFQASSISPGNENCAGVQFHLPSHIGTRLTPGGGRWMAGCNPIRDRTRGTPHETSAPTSAVH